MYACMCVRACACMCMHVHAHVYVYMCLCVCTCMCLCICVQVLRQGVFGLGRNSSFQQGQVDLDALSVVSPFRSNSTNLTSGAVSYAVFSTADTDVLERVSLYISRQVGRRFYGTFMIVADWRNLEEIGGFSGNVST